MIRTIFLSSLILAFTLSHSSFASDNVNEVTNQLKTLVLSQSSPEVFSRTDTDGEITSLYFAGELYQGKPTRIFAYYKAPEGEGPFPAIVLVHGGGGSAYQTWVKKWNEAGFAAISIAVEGQTGSQIDKRPPNKWQKHEWAGPSRQGIYADSDKPLTEQWMYHATSAVIKAHTLLRSFDEIKPDQIGLSGISWGGVITATVIGFDNRFAFAIPIYGSGNLATMDNQYGEALKDNASYHRLWEPAIRISSFTKPTFWLTGLKETHFSLDAQANTYKLLTGQNYQSIQPKLKHNHVAAWTPQEPYIFARSVINDQALPSFYQGTQSFGSLSIKVKDIKNIETATLYYTNDSGHTFKRKWQQLPVIVDSSSIETQLTASLPKLATAWLFSVEINGLIYSSELFER